MFLDINISKESKMMLEEKSIGMEEGTASSNRIKISGYLRCSLEDEGHPITW